MSTLIENLRNPIDSLHIALLARKLNDPATAHVFVDECRDMLDKAPTEDIKAEMSLKIANEMFSHTKDEKVKGVAAAAMNMKGEDICLNNARLAACNTALSMVTSPVSGPADSALCSAALATMKKARGSFIVEAFVPEILKVSNNPSLKAAFDCVEKYAAKYSGDACYGYEAYDNTMEVCSSHHSDSPELLLALTAAKISRGDRLGHFGCKEISRYYIDEIVSITRDDTTRIVAETVSRICNLDTVDRIYFKGSVFYPLFEMLAEVIEQPRQSDNPAEVLASAEKSLYLKWDNDKDSDDLIKNKAAGIFEEEIAKAGNEYSARESVKDMVEAVSGGNEAPDIEEGNDYILIDGVKLEKR
ncbi:MAG: hypothetical protein AB9903_19480 [Vulcanimicrobiota bacterium]